MKKRGHSIGRFLVRSVMREYGLNCRVRRAYKGTGNKPNQAFIFTKHNGLPTHTNSLWVTDITSIRTTTGWRYLSVVLDAFSRRVIGCSFAKHIRTELVLESLDQAHQQRSIEEDAVVIHSDRGSQYTSFDWHNKVGKLNMIGSMSDTGNCYDNATMERFFGSLKDALMVDEPLMDASPMRANIDQWIVKYNHQRDHSALGGLTPAQFERESLPEVA